MTEQEKSDTQSVWGDRRKATLLVMAAWLITTLALPGYMYIQAVIASRIADRPVTYSFAGAWVAAPITATFLVASFSLMIACIVAVVSRRTL